MIIEQYISECYYESKTKDFYELKMGQMTSDEYFTMFLGLLRYVQYLMYKKVKIQRFMNGLPMVFKDKIEFSEPSTLKDAIKKLKYFYEKVRHRPNVESNWPAKSTIGWNRNWPMKHPERKEGNHQTQKGESHQKENFDVLTVLDSLMFTRSAW